MEMLSTRGAANVCSFAEDASARLSLRSFYCAIETSAVAFVFRLGKQSEVYGEAESHLFYVLILHRDKYDQIFK